MVTMALGLSQLAGRETGGDAKPGEASLGPERRSDRKGRAL
jgi:hypothetical protein